MNKLKTVAPVSPVSQEYLSVAQLSKYSGVSERTLWDLLKNPIDPIPHFRFGTAGRIVRIRKTEFDTWAERQRKHDSSEAIDALVAEIIGGSK